MMLRGFVLGDKAPQHEGEHADRRYLFRISPAPIRHVRLSVTGVTS
ncbi:hypothetical protein DSM25559_2715 [Agrobacterium rosae]|uniref:Uncharacterized protein n=1 Tax=Agrobacterium rosae TaxID=1972867 RepID=A0A1R3TQG9_9HYPH|nr:hypothetical protein DSM25559_2715 [Agrobacterium rosae]